MGAAWSKLSILSTLLVFLCAGESLGQSTYDQDYIKTSLKELGNEILLKSADSISKFPSVTMENDQYILEFATEFGFFSNQLVQTANDIIEETNIASGYFLEVEECISNEVIFSFEMERLDSMKVVLQEDEEYLKACYRLVFTLIGRPEKENTPEIKFETSNLNKSEEVNYLRYLFLVVSVSLLIALFIRRREYTKD